MVLPARFPTHDSIFPENGNSNIPESLSICLKGRNELSVRCLPPSFSLLLDPILVNMLMGHNQVNGTRTVKAHSEHSSSKRRLRRSGDRGTIAEIAERLRASREQPAIRGGWRIRKEHVEIARESYTHTSTLFSSIFRSFLLTISL